MIATDDKINALWLWHWERETLSAPLTRIIILQPEKKTFCSVIGTSKISMFKGRHGETSRNVEWFQGFKRNGSCVGSMIMVNKSWPRAWAGVFYNVLVGNVLARIYLLSPRTFKFQLCCFFVFTVSFCRLAVILKREICCYFHIQHRYLTCCMFLILLSLMFHSQ